MARKSDPYSNIVFEKHVDWVNVNPVLLQTVNRIARSRGEVVDVFSGYRSDEYSASHGGFAGDPHTRRGAIDAYVNGKPIGEVWPATVFKAANLRSGNQPNFYHGKPDPEHVDLFVDGTDGGADYTGTVPSTAASSSNQGGAPASGLTAGALIQQDMANAEPPPGGPSVGANVAALPGTALIGPTRKPQYETWNLLAALPGASPDTMRMAQYAGLQNTP